MNGVSSIFSFNKAGSGGGGAMQFQSISNVVLDEVTVSNNYAIGVGGGIAAVQCRNFFLTNSDIYLNSGSEGGGLHLIEILSRPKIQNVLIRDNVARDGKLLLIDSKIFLFSC
jgi:predicted outer membrane repeat protein